MTDRALDLIQRAAARLSIPAKTDSAVVDSRPSERLPLERSESRGSDLRDRGLSPGNLRTVSLSPTSLAAHGIALPSGGFSRTREEFRAIKREVLACASRDSDGASAARRVILVTSARPGEGKTFTAANLALALAFEQDTRVLLVDADAYRQSLLEYLGISAENGWLDAVFDTARPVSEFVLKTNIPGLSILPSGKDRGEIPELMAGRRMSRLIDGLLQEDPARFIVFDSLPCLTSTEPSILAGLAGQTLFVVAAHRTGRNDVEASLRLLGASPNVNLVLNKAEPMLTEQFRDYGYAYAYQR